MGGVAFFTALPVSLTPLLTAANTQEEKVEGSRAPRPMEAFIWCGPLILFYVDEWHTSCPAAALRVWGFLLVG